MAPRSTIRIKHKPLPEDSFLGNFLDPLDRLSETLFALMIMLSFTLAIRFSLLESGSHAPVSPEYVNKLVIMMLTAIVGWGTIDGILYALLSVFDRGEKQRLLLLIQTSTSPEESVDAVAEKLDPVLEPITGAAQRQLLYEDVLAHLSDSRPKPVRVRRDDLIRRSRLCTGGGELWLPRWRPSCSCGATSCWRCGSRTWCRSACCLRPAGVTATTAG